MIIRKPFNEWESATKIQLLSMTLDFGSMMKEMVRNRSKTETYVYFNNEIPIAWAAIIKSTNKIYKPNGFYTKQKNKVHEVMIYVHNDWRKKGIGTKIMQSIIKHTRLNVCVYGHNKNSTTFFKKISKSNKRVKDQWRLN